MRDRDLSASLSSSSVGGHSRAAQVTKKFSKLILRWRLLTWSLCALEDMQLMSRSSSDHRLVAEAVWLQKKKTTVKNATKSKCRIVEHNRTDFLHHLHLDLQIPRCTLSYNFSIMTSNKNNTSLDTFHTLDTFQNHSIHGFLIQQQRGVAASEAIHEYRWDETLTTQ